MSMPQQQPPQKSFVILGIALIGFALFAIIGLGNLTKQAEKEKANQEQKKEVVVPEVNYHAGDKISVTKGYYSGCEAVLHGVNNWSVRPFKPSRVSVLFYCHGVDTPIVDILNVTDLEKMRKTN